SVARHPTVEAARARIRAAQGSRQTASAFGNPIIGYQVDNTPFPGGGLVADVRRQIADKVSLPSGSYVTYGGQFENQARATRRLALIVPLVLLLIAGLLYASFGTVRHALLVMLNVPFAVVGGIAALWLRGIHLNLSASVGFIALFGVAVLNGVVLVSSINQVRETGQTTYDARSEEHTS